MRQLSHKVEQLRVLQRQYELCIPPSLTRSSRVMQLEQQTLVLAADNGAVAAKIRQLAPHLAQLFLDSGHEVTGIQVKVQVAWPSAVRISAPPARAGGQKKLINSIRQMADSPLKKALQKLARNGK